MIWDRTSKPTAVSESPSTETGWVGIGLFLRIDPALGDYDRNAKKINESYVGRVLRLTLLAPDIIESILRGRQPVGWQLGGLMKRFPVEWRAQRDGFTRVS